MPEQTDHPDRSHMATALISRRSFLQGAGAGLTLCLLQLAPRATRPAAAAVSAASASQAAAYAGWGDVYRGRWRWDRVAKGTHYVNCAYQRGCAWNVYVRDGVVWREEQVASYD